MAVRNMEAINRAASLKTEEHDNDVKIFRDAEQKVLQLHGVTVDFVDTLVAIKKKDLLYRYKDWDDACWPTDKGGGNIYFYVKVDFVPEDWGREREIYFCSYVEGTHQGYEVHYYPDEDEILIVRTPRNDVGGGGHYTTDEDLFRWMDMQPAAVVLYSKLLENLAVRIQEYCNDFFKWVEDGLKSKIVNCQIVNRQIVK